MTASTSQILHWQDQSVNEDMAWAKTRVPDLSQEALDAYKAGLNQGWRSALSTIKLHGLLKGWTSGEPNPFKGD